MGFDRLMQMIRSLQRWLADSQQSAIVEYFRRMRRAEAGAKEVVLVQCVEDLYCLGIFGQIVSSLRESRPIRAEQYVLRSLRVGESRSLTGFVLSRLFINALHSFKWVRIYKSFCDGVAYRSVSIRPIGDVIDACRAWLCWRGLTDKDSLLGLQMEGIVVGDLINDSFLRFKPAPTLNLKDVYLLVLLWQAYRDVRRANEYFVRVRPALYLTSYSTYIQHGIPARAALRNGVRVFSFGNFQEFTKELTLQDWVHTKNPDGYAKEFLELDRQDAKLALAEQALSARLSGGVDGATAYMKKSAYAGSADTVPDVRGAVVIFLHDFYDSPHVYREMVFPDFWEWLCFTIETLRSANIPFFIKPHPNQISLSAGVLDEIKHCYPGLSMIPVGVTNKQLVEAGMSCAVTVYGTVAHEVAYLGVPSIACAHHPHISFGFCKTAQTRDEYQQLLNSSIRLSFDKEVMRRESLVFYYMHNLHLSEEMKVLRDVSMTFRRNCENAGEGCDLVGALKQIAVLPGYRQSVVRMI